jgi:hypothetical protein
MRLPPVRAWIINARFEMLFDAGSFIVWFSRLGAFIWYFMWLLLSNRCILNGQRYYFFDDSPRK